MGEAQGRVTPLEKTVSYFKKRQNERMATGAWSKKTSVLFLDLGRRITVTFPVVVRRPTERVDPSPWLTQHCAGASEPTFTALTLSWHCEGPPGVESWGARLRHCGETSRHQWQQRLKTPRCREGNRLTTEGLYLRGTPWRPGRYPTWYHWCVGTTSALGPVPRSAHVGRSNSPDLTLGPSPRWSVSSKTDRFAVTFTGHSNYINFINSLYFVNVCHDYCTRCKSFIPDQSQSHLHYIIIIRTVTMINDNIS